MPVYCFEECAAKGAARLSGSTDPYGVETDMLKNWLLCHLHEAMATWVDWLSNGSPPVKMVCTIALDKTPGVHPLGVGESWMQLWSDCSYTKTNVAATNACGNTQLCADLWSGVKANLHAVRAIWPQSAGWAEESGVVEEEDDGNQ